MTERLYYTDPALLEFEAEIAETKVVDGKSYTALDKSAFYPTSGGQQYDTGYLNDVKIIDVLEEADIVWHISEKPVGETGQAVKGTIDAKRRMGHRQQHTAQHIISQVAYGMYEYGTVSVHLGDDYGLVEFGVETIPDDQLEIMETEANRMVADNLPVKILFIDAEKSDKIPLRRPPKRSGTIRVIQIGEKEFSACGGTHCNSSGEVMMIKFVGLDKVHGNCGIRFLAGEQAFDDYSIRFKVTDTLSKKLTCNIVDLEAKFDKLTDELKQAKLKAAEYQRTLLPQEAESLAGKVKTSGSTNYLIEEIDGYDPKTAGKLAQMTAEKIDGVAVLVNDTILHIGSSTIPAGKVAKLLVERFQLKGGGGPTQAQVAGIDVKRIDEYRDVLIETFS